MNEDTHAILKNAAKLLRRASGCYSAAVRAKGDIDGRLAAEADYCAKTAAALQARAVAIGQPGKAGTVDPRLTEYLKTMPAHTGPAKFVAE